MTIAITDANIFIDLIELDLITHLFEIELHVQTTTAVILELHPHQSNKLKPYINTGKLTLRSLTSENETQISCTEFNKGFSETDKTLLFFCQADQLLMITGESLMRKYCHKCGLEVRGIIWLFDSFVSIR